MTKDDLTKNGSVSEFVWFMRERQKIYKLRTQGQDPPWTDDWVLQNYFFCNVFREQDKVTAWLCDHWRSRSAPEEIMIFNMVVARMFNWIPTLQAIGFTANKWNREKIQYALLRLEEAGVKIFSEAYLIAGTDLSGKSKVVGVLDRMDFAWEHRKRIAQLIKGDTLAQAWWVLQEIPGVAGFIAYEIVTDLRHTPVLQRASDINTWANPGPGAVRGLRRIYGLGIAKSIALPLMSELLPRAQMKFKELLEMRDIEHSLCEYDKYKRIVQMRLEQKPIRGVRKYHGTGVQVQHRRYDQNRARARRHYPFPT